jgi:SNF2 family DNA or RNA helicase
LNDIDDVQNILIVAPLRVANSVWLQESRLWGHLRDLDIVVATGTQKQRIDAINKRARITVTNQENLPWLINNSGIPWRWDMLVYDESTGIKNPSAIRFKALKRITKYLKRVILLTATPLPNGMLDLWSQIYLLDGGERLGRSMSQYKARYFTPVGFMGYGYQLNAGAKEEIMNKISDLTLTLDVEDLLEMPDRVDLTEYVEMSPSLMKKYKGLEKDFLYELAEDNAIEVLHAAALANKLLQFASGCVYDEDGEVHFIHDEKIQRLRELREAHPNENMLVAYNFKFELEALLKAFPDAVLLDKKGEAIVDWNNGKIPMLIANPKSASMGLNLQKGSSILIWFGMSWSLLDYEQFNGRLYRQGQKNKVRIVHILTKGTMDDKVYSAIKAKAKTQSDVLGHLKLYNGEF